MENKANGISVQLGKGENRITVHGTWLRCLKVAFFSSVHSAVCFRLAVKSQTAESK